QTQFIVTSLTACVLLYTHSVGIAYFIIGALACSFSVKAVKKLVKQPRPLGKSKKVTYGMPSTHSATISYYAVYICASCRYLLLHDNLKFAPEGLLRTLVPITALPWASLIVISRVWLGHHTWPQVAVGSGYGIAFASLWFALWTAGGLDAHGLVLEELFVNHLLRG
ncbi:hypothetical protein M422DRAFT_191102, partial [Sphaerobolus stellatus SS14]